MSDERPRHPGSRAATARWIVTALMALALGGCAHGAEVAGGKPVSTGPEPDSVTTALWHMDETGGTRVADSGPFRLDGIAGLDASTTFGRYGRARVFTHSLDSFVQVGYNPALEAPDGFTIEAWIWLSSYGIWEDTPIAGRWDAATGDRSWLFSIVGQSLRPPLAPALSPGDHTGLVGVASAGVLMFAFLTEDAGAPRSYFSTRPIELKRWTHVAATFDGSVVRIWIDGLPDAQYAVTGRLRASQAPLQVGNAVDPRWLSSFGGDLRADQARNSTPFYALDGLIDELRISSAARSGFPGVKGR